MGRSLYWFARDASWAITNEITKKKRTSRSNYAKKGTTPKILEKDTNNLYKVDYQSERKKVIICSCISLVSSICGLIFLYFEIMWPFFCVLIWGSISWFASMIIIINTDQTKKTKRTIPEGEEKNQSKLRKLRFAGCLSTFLVSLSYIFPAMEKGTTITTILGIVALVAIGYPFVCSIKDL